MSNKERLYFRFLKLILFFYSLPYHNLFYFYLNLNSAQCDDAQIHYFCVYPFLVFFDFT